MYQLIMPKPEIVVGRNATTLPQSRQQAERRERVQYLRRGSTLKQTDHTEVPWHCLDAARLSYKR